MTDDDNPTPPTRPPDPAIVYAVDAESESQSPSRRGLDVSAILDRLRRGDAWAWFCARVSATITLDGESFTGCDYLGACSYADEAAFRGGPFFGEMCQRARDDLLRNIRAAVQRGELAKRALARAARAS